jgi:hypothetical protein
MKLDSGRSQFLPVHQQHQVAERESASKAEVAQLTDYL